MSQHQPHQGTTTEGMSFTTRWKGKKNRKAQHHTALSSIPLPEKGRTTQETTSYYRTNDLKKKKSRRMPDHHFLQKDTDTDLQQSERLLVSKTRPLSQKQTVFMPQWLPVSLAYLSCSWKWFGPAADQPQRARTAGENFDSDFDSDIFLLYTVD